MAAVDVGRHCCGLFAVQHRGRSWLLSMLEGTALYCLLFSTEEGRGCCRCWKALLWIDDWKKSIVYILLTAPCFTSKLRGGFSILAGTGFMFFYDRLLSKSLAHSV